MQVPDPKNPVRGKETREAVTFSGPTDSVYLKAKDYVQLDVGTGEYKNRKRKMAPLLHGHADLCWRAYPCMCTATGLCANQWWAQDGLSFAKLGPHTSRGRTWSQPVRTSPAPLTLVPDRRWGGHHLQQLERRGGMVALDRAARLLPLLRVRGERAVWVARQAAAKGLLAGADGDGSGGPLARLPGAVALCQAQQHVCQAQQALVERFEIGTCEG